MLKPIKTTILSCLSLAMLSLFSPTRAEVQNFTGNGQSVNRSPHIQAELKALATMQAERKAREQAAAYLTTLPQMKKVTLTKAQLLALTLMLADFQIFDAQPITIAQESGFEVKAKVTIDTDLVPRNIEQFLEERYQPLQLNQYWLLHSQEIEEALQKYVAKVANTGDPVQIGELKQTEGKHVQDLVLSGKAFQEGWHFFGRERFDEALESFNLAIQRDPTYASFYFARGAAHFYKNMFDNAIQDFAKAVELNPRDPVFYYARGASYLKQKILFQEAANDMSKAIELKPDYSAAYYARGAAYAFLKNCSRAEQDFQKACQMGWPKACKAECKHAGSDD